MSIEYRHNTSSQLDILYHLQSVSSAFVDDLSERVNLSEYAKKLYTYAEREELWLGTELIGLVAYYINAETRKAFITNVSVDVRFQKRGIATELLDRAKLNSIKRNVDVIYLEVANDEHLIEFYAKRGFLFKEKKDSNYELYMYLKPLVAIRCTVYNHEPYIRECLDGFVMQKTNFKFVAIVHDDASTDGSAAIIREYEEKYPNIIKPIYETENQYSKNDGSLRRIMDAAINETGAKYVALCEGDDYWIDPYKLQKQVDFLEANPNYTMCYTNYSNVDKNNLPIIWTNREANIKRSKTGDIFAELLKGNFIQTCTILYRDSICRDPLYLGGLDYACALQNAMMGECVFIKDTTACYRLQPNSLIHTQNDIIKQVSMDIWCRYVIRYLNQKKYRKSAISHIQVMSVISSKLISMLRTKSSNDKEMAKTIMHTHPIINFYLPFGIAIRMFNVIRKNLVRK